MNAFLKVGPTGQFGFLALAGAVGGPCGLLVTYQPLETMAGGVLTWWTALCLISIGNIELWRRSAVALAQRGEDIDPAIYRHQRWQLILSAGYVFGCAFRSILPRADVQRFGLFDSWLSSVLVGRSVATVAELCFAAQWALLLYMLAKETRCRPGVVIAALLVPLIAVAEVCSWYGVLTTAYIGNAIEESIWALSAVLLVIGAVTVWPRCKTGRPFLAALIVLGSAYVVFMCAVDVPMYVSRWLTDEANGRAYLPLTEGLWDAGTRWTVSHRWEEWHPEIPWMSLYFSVGVWCSLALVHVPRWERSSSAGVNSIPAPAVS